MPAAQAPNQFELGDREEAGVLKFAACAIISKAHPFLERACLFSLAIIVLLPSELDWQPPSNLG